MRDYLTIGSVPYGEPCAQVGSDNYDRNSRLECEAFIGQITREFGFEPNGAFLMTKSFPHEFGSYREVVVLYDDDYDAAVDRRKGITVEDIDGNQLICLNRADFKRAGSLYYYQQMFDLIIEAIHVGQITPRCIYDESGYTTMISKFSQMSQCAFK